LGPGSPISGHDDGQNIYKPGTPGGVVSTTDEIPPENIVAEDDDAFSQAGKIFQNA
jgi:hypothetical protein